MENLKFIIDEIENDKIGLDEAKVEFVEAYIYGYVNDEEIEMAEEIGFISKDEYNYIYRELYESIYETPFSEKLEESKNIKNKIDEIKEKAKKIKVKHGEIKKIAKDEIEEDNVEGNSDTKKEIDSRFEK